MRSIKEIRGVGSPNRILHTLLLLQWMTVIHLRSNKACKKPRPSNWQEEVSLEEHGGESEFWPVRGNKRRGGGNHLEREEEGDAEVPSYGTKTQIVVS